VVTEKYARKWIDSDITYGGYGIALRWSNNERESDLRAIVCGLRTAIYSRVSIHEYGIIRYNFVETLLLFLECGSAV
jgi:hypothetical protein